MARWRRWTIALIPGKEPAITMEAKAWLTALRVGKRRSLAIRTNCEQPGFWPAMPAPAKGSVPAAPLGRERNRARNPQFLYGYDLLTTSPQGERQSKDQDNPP
jgi:hypothetical protein